MLRRLILPAVWLLLVCGCSKSLELRNDSERAIIDVRLASPGSGSYGEDLLGAGSVAALGGSFSFDFFDCARFDVRLTVAKADGAPEGAPDEQCVLPDLSLCDGTWRVTNDNLTACGIAVGGGDGGIEGGIEGGIDGGADGRADGRADGADAI